MTLGYNENTKEYTFHLTQDEFVELTNGKPIKLMSSNKDYKKTEFILTFKGKLRKLKEDKNATKSR